MTIRSRQLLDHAKGATCQNCGRQDGTIVAAHANRQALGKGMGEKAPDIFTAHLCYACHTWLDQGGTGTDPSGLYLTHRMDKWEMFDRAMHRTWAYLWGAGIIGLKDEPR